MFWVFHLPLPLSFALTGRTTHQHRVVCILTLNCCAIIIFAQCAPRISLIQNTQTCIDGSSLTSVRKTDKMLAKNNKHKDKDKTKNNSINNTYGRANCAIAFDECNTACTGGPEVGLFGRFRTPEPGTCALVCTVVREGCTRYVCGHATTLRESGPNSAPSLEVQIQLE